MFFANYNSNHHYLCRLIVRHYPRIATRKPTGSTGSTGGFSELFIPGLKPVTMVRKKPLAKWLKPPRASSMKTNHDWTSVWPAAATFNPSSVPLPLRQGFIKNSTENAGVVPDRFGNLELMKIPNFLHLSPRHIKLHCAALKGLCSPWPADLASDADVTRHLPMEVVTRAFVRTGPLLRDARARSVTLRLPLAVLHLEQHARDKLLRLCGPDRYDAATDSLVLTADRCPSRKQNHDYLIYVLTALSRESRKVEAWESEKTEADWERYHWERSVARASALRLLARRAAILEEGGTKTGGAGGEQEEEEEPGADHATPTPATGGGGGLPPPALAARLEARPEMAEYRSAVERLHDGGDEAEAANLDRYRGAVLRLLGYHQPEHHSQSPHDDSYGTGHGTTAEESAASKATA